MGRGSEAFSGPARDSDSELPDMAWAVGVGNTSQMAGNRDRACTETGEDEGCKGDERPGGGKRGSGDFSHCRLCCLSEELALSQAPFVARYITVAWRSLVVEHVLRYVVFGLRDLDQFMLLVSVELPGLFARFG